MKTPIKAAVFALGLVSAASALPASAQPAGGYGQHRGGGGEAVIFTHPEYRGDALTVTGPIYHLHEAGFNDTVSSIQVRGTWELCSDPDFRGRCEIVEGSISHLYGIGLNDNISSMRPVSGRARPISAPIGAPSPRPRGDSRRQNAGVEGRRSVFFAQPRDAYGDPIRADRGSARQFCSEQGLGQPLYADTTGRNLSDVLCSK